MKSPYSLLVLSQVHRNLRVLLPYRMNPSRPLLFTVLPSLASINILLLFFFDRNLPQSFPCPSSVFVCGPCVGSISPLPWPSDCSRESHSAPGGGPEASPKLARSSNPPESPPMDPFPGLPGPRSKYRRVAESQSKIRYLTPKISKSSPILKSVGNTGVPFFFQTIARFTSVPCGTPLFNCGRSTMFIVPSSS